MITVWVYTDTSKQIGDADQLKIFADQDAADKCSGSTILQALPLNIPLSGSSTSA